MKTQIFSLVTFGCFLAACNSSVNGQDLERLFSRLDRNSDGVIDADEMPEQAKKRLLSRDSDGDGKVSREEMLAAMDANKNRENGEPSKRRPETGKKSDQAANSADRFKQLLKRLDKNRNGKLELSELPEKLRDRLSKLDTDGDKTISQEELKAAGSKGKAAEGPEGKSGKDRLEAMMNRLPRNKDGLVDLAAIENENLSNRLSKLDSNGDNLLDQAELEALRERMRKDMPGDSGKNKSDRKADRGAERSPQLPKRPSAEGASEDSNKDSNTDSIEDGEG